MPEPGSGSGDLSGAYDAIAEYLEDALAEWVVDSIGGDTRAAAAGLFSRISHVIWRLRWR